MFYANQLHLKTGPQPQIGDVLVLDSGAAPTAPERVGYDGLPVALQLTDEVILTDLGARPGAQGRANLDGNGGAAAYVVAEGDTQAAIAERFGADAAYLALLNSIRRTDVYVDPTTVEGYVWPDALPAGTGWVMALYAGDTLNLSPYMVASVGDQNGVVYTNEPDIAMPPQR